MPTKEMITLERVTGLRISQRDLTRLIEEHQPDAPMEQRYALKGAYQEELKSATEITGVTLNHLGKLLGVGESTNVYKWMSDSSTRKMSSLYAIRLCRLYRLHFHDGYPLASIRRIDWATDTGYLRDRDSGRDDAVFRLVPVAKR